MRVLPTRGSATCFRPQSKVLAKSTRRKMYQTLSLRYVFKKATMSFFPLFFFSSPTCQQFELSRLFSAPGAADGSCLHQVFTLIKPYRFTNPICQRVQFRLIS